jgi:APA family basic amino acid/polyamine antiporter
MIGAGLFTVFGPASAAAGSWLLAGLLVAAVAAFANATSSAQLAAQYPLAGGAFVYGRERLGEWPGFIAGWGFITGKTASCAAMALVIAENLSTAGLISGGWVRPVAVAALVGAAALNARGITKTAAATRVIVAVVLLGMAALLAAAWSLGRPDLGRFSAAAESGAAPPWGGILESAGLIFFAFAGYARIATMAADVKDPRRSIPRAILAALGAVVVLYSATAVTLLAVLGPAALSSAAAPVALLANALVGAGDSSASAVGPTLATAAVALLAGLAAGGALLGLVAGLSRTVQAMASAGELPRPLSALHIITGVPQRAEITVTVLAIVAALIGDIRSVIGFSSFGVLTYYFVANAAAFTQTGRDRLYPRVLQVLGGILCVVIALSVPVEGLAAGGVVLAAGILWRIVWKAVN